jgi:hypothetical protein
MVQCRTYDEAQARLRKARRELETATAQGLPALHERDQVRRFREQCLAL